MRVLCVAGSMYREDSLFHGGVHMVVEEKTLILLQDFGVPHRILTGESTYWDDMLGSRHGDKEKAGRKIGSFRCPAFFITI